MELVIVFGIIAALLLTTIYLAPKGWRTVAANAISIALVAFGAVLEFLSGFNWGEVLPPHIAPWVVLGIAVVNIGLRAVTTTRLGMKRPEAPETPQDVV